MKTSARRTFIPDTAVRASSIASSIRTAVRDENKRHIVLCEYTGELLVLDLEDGITTVKSKEEALGMIGIKTGDGMTAYEFNNKMYNDLI